MKLTQKQKRLNFAIFIKSKTNLFMEIFLCLVFSTFAMVTPFYEIGLDELVFDSKWQKKTSVKRKLQICLDVARGNVTFCKLGKRFFV